MHFLKNYKILSTRKVTKRMIKRDLKKVSGYILKVDYPNPYGL
jgi:hypothetical protein